MVKELTAYDREVIGSGSELPLCYGAEVFRIGSSIHLGSAASRCMEFPLQSVGFEGMCGWCL